MGLKERAQRLREQLKTADAEASAKWSELVTARTALGQVENITTECEEFKAAKAAQEAFDVASKDAQDIKETLDGVLELLGTEAPAGETGGDFLSRNRARGGEDGEPPAASIGERFVTSEVFKELHDRLPSTSGGSKMPIGNTAAVRVCDRVEAKQLMVVRNAVFSTPGDGLVPAQRLSGIRPAYEAPLTILDLVTFTETDSTRVEWVREKSFTSAAAETAESTQLAAGTKPESTLELEVVGFDVKTIAHWIPATKQALRDVAGVRSMIDAKMVWGLRRRLARQLMIGNGEGANLTGILETADLPSVELAAGYSAAALIEAIYDSIMTVYDATGEWPTATFLSRADHKLLRFAREASAGSDDPDTGGFLFGPPQAATPIDVEGVPCLVNADATTGNPITGVWRELAVWMHEGISTSVSDSHSTFFIENKVAILSEFAAAAGPMDINAFCEVAPPAGS